MSGIELIRKRNKTTNSLKEKGFLTVYDCNEKRTLILKEVMRFPRVNPRCGYANSHTVVGYLDKQGDAVFTEGYA
ncbi:TPA: hypothetical protein ACIRLG_000723 [Streptococcus suis]